MHQLFNFPLSEFIGVKGLLQMNQVVKAALAALCLPLTYIEHDHDHNHGHWSVWLEMNSEDTRPCSNRGQRYIGKKLSNADKSAFVKLSAKLSISKN